MAGKPGLGNLQIDKLVTSFARRHENHEFKADIVMPAKLHNKTRGVYYVFDRAHQSLRDSDLTLQDPSDWKSEAKEVEYDLTSGNFAMQLYRLKEVVGLDQIRDAGDPLEPVEDAARNVRGKLLLGKEQRFHDLIFTTGNYATGNKVDLANSLQWSNYTTATGAKGPLRQVYSGTLVLDKKVGPGRRIMVMTPDVQATILRHPDLLESLKYTAMATKSGVDQAMAALFGVDELHVMKAIKNAVPEGGTASMTFIASDAVAILTQPERQGVRSVAFGIQFASANMPVGMRRTLDSRMNAIEVEVADEYVFKLVDSSAGYLIKDVLA